MRIKCLNTYVPKVPDQSLGHGEYSVCLLALPTCGQVNWCLRCGTEMSQEHQPSLLIPILVILVLRTS